MIETSMLFYIESFNHLCESFHEIDVGGLNLSGVSHWQVRIEFPYWTGKYHDMYNIFQILSLLSGKVFISPNIFVIKRHF